MMKEGVKALDFCLKDAEGKNVCLKDYRGRWVVLYFYPKDLTPGCTLEALDFSVLKKDFEKKNAVILGVSKDSCESHQKFIDKKKLTIRLLSDPDSEVQKSYGVWRLKKFMGKEFTGTVRTTVLIDPTGKIMKVWGNVKVKGHANEVFAAIA
ncbi:MAG: thioredoxin-dependent thiol peroxidase [Methanobacteriota archaeon]